MSVDVDRLLKLRLVVARVGEMDNARWWNTSGQLGSLGRKALRRGFPRTHYFAQARAVMAVAAQRCREVFDPPNCVTLWSLPALYEEEFEVRWEHWLDNRQAWESFFQQVETIRGADLSAALRDLSMVSENDLEASGRLRRSAEGRAVLLPGTFSGSDQDVALLALGFARGDVGTLAVPYQRRENGA